MRLISQDGYVDIPYELSALSVGDFADKIVIYVRSKLFDEKPFVIAEYSSETKALIVMESLRKAYSGFPMIIGDDMLKKENNFEKLKKIFPTEIIECPKDAKVEFFGSLTFRFPKNDEV